MKKILFLFGVYCGLTLPCLAQKHEVASGAEERWVRTPINSHVTSVTPTNLQLGCDMSVKVSDLSNLLTAAELNSKQIVLFVNGIELPDVTAVGKMLDTNALFFQLKRTPENMRDWAPLLRRPFKDHIRPISISVGLHGDSSPLVVDVSARNITLTVVEWNTWTTPWAILFVVLLIGFIVISTFSNVLKSPEPDANGRYGYSLSRTQAAFWMFITTMSFVFIWVVTSDLATLNASVLALIGISSGTYLSAALLEKPIDKKVSPATNPVSPITVEPMKLGNAQKAVNRIRNIRFIGQFLGDILSDEKGISVPRFQIFVWTIVLGIIFVVSVVNELSMPEFNGTLLGLMAISSATYVGAKMNQ